MKLKQDYPLVSVPEAFFPKEQKRFEQFDLWQPGAHEGPYVQVRPENDT